MATMQDTIDAIMRQYGAPYASNMPDFSKVDPAVLKQIIRMNATKEQQDQLDLQMRLANQMQISNEGAKDTNHGEAMQTGSLYIPPNPMDTATRMYTHLQGIMDANSGKKNQGVLNKKMQDALDSWSDFLHGGNPQPNPQLDSANTAASTLSPVPSSYDDEDTGDSSQW
jgi:hypothetical protein